MAKNDTVKMVGKDGTTVEVAADDKKEINRLRYGWGYSFAKPADEKKATAQ